MSFHGGTRRKTILLDEHNVATFRLAAGYKRFDLFCQEAQIDLDAEQVCPLTVESVAVISDDDSDDISLPEDHVEQDPTFDGSDSLPKATSFSLDGPTFGRPAPVVVEDEEDRQTTNVTAEFLRYHQKFNHCSPKRMQLLARVGVIPRRLARCPVPVCSSCLYGKATRRPWRHKTNDNAPSDGYVPTKPGEVVSVDQMKSSTPGLVAQMAGFLTKKRYVYATVFVDHATDYSYVHFQKSDNAEETLEAKETF